MEYRIEKYHPDLKDQVVRLQTLLWSPDEALNRDYFDWKYERNPYDPSPHVYLALCAETVVGMRGLVGARWQLGSPEKTAVIFCAADLVIHPDHRSMNLLMRINQTAFDDLAMSGHDYVFNLSASQVNQIASLATGWRATKSVQVAVRAPMRYAATGRLREGLKRNPWVRKHLKKIQFIRKYSESRVLYSRTELEPFHSLDRDGEDQYAHINPKISLSKTPRPAEMANLVKSLDRRGRIQHVRDEEYFTWRFGNPRMLHRFFFWDEEGLQGYLVLGKAAPQSQGHQHVSILDWEAPDDHVRAGLLDAALSAIPFSSVHTWSATLPSKTQAILRDRNFRSSKDPKDLAHQDRRILVRAVRSTPSEPDWLIGDLRLLDLEHWDIRPLYDL